MAELYNRFETLFLQGHDFRADYVSESGHRITAFDRNFFHLVQLKKVTETETISFFNIQDEKPLIKAQTEGFGPYQFDQYRANHLGAGLDTILRPHAVFALKDPKTAHLAFLKHYGDKPYPVMISLVGRSTSDECLIPITCFPCRLNQAKNRFKQWSDGGLLWRKGDEPTVALKDQQPAC